jgi:PKD repeat protein
MNGQGTDVAQYQWLTAGSYDVTLEAENCGGLVSDTHTVTIHPACIGLTGVTIAGPAAGLTDTVHTFTARLSPRNASTAPITYTWSPPPDSGQGTAVATYSWSTLGERTISLTVENCDGTASDDHTISIQEFLPAYLPLVIRGYRYAPDLEVTEIQVVWGVGAVPDYALVTIRNNGPAPVTVDFWVDLYLDPSRVPAVGDLWNDLSDHGKAWLVRNPDLGPGETLVLDTRAPDDPDNPELRYSDWPDQLPVGTHAIYAQVDSYWRPSGLVIELNEGNNLLDISYTQGATHAPPTPPPPPVLPTVPEPIRTPDARSTPAP